MASFAYEATGPSVAINRRRNRPRTWCSLLTAGCLFFTGCVSSKYKKVPAKEPAKVPVVINAALGTEPVATTLNTVIVYQGPGSWKLAAFWDEYAVTLRNDASEVVTLDAVVLLDYAGAARTPGNNPWTLEKESKTLEKQYKENGLAFVRYAGPVAVLGLVSVGAAYASAGAVLLGSGTGAGAAAVSVASQVLIPVYLVTVISINQSRKHAIEHEFHQRRLLFPLVIKPGEVRSGSLFFPMVPSPQRLEITWHKSGSQGTAQLPLAMLSGLHVDPNPQPAEMKPGAPTTPSG